MAATREIKMILAGAYAGQTRVLKDLLFVEGEYTLVGSEVEVLGLVGYLGKCYRAYPENSRELAAAQAVDAAAAGVKDDGERNLQESAGNQSGDNDLSDGGVQPTGSGPASPSADDRSGAADPAAGPEILLPVGDGHQDAGIPVAPGSGSPERIRAALAQLDPANNEQWCSDGKPTMEAVQAFYGSADISRSAVVALFPNFKRETPELDT